MQHRAAQASDRVSRGGGQAGIPDAAPRRQATANAEEKPDISKLEAAVES